jgi:hypothetical protein
MSTPEIKALVDRIGALEAKVADQSKAKLFELSEKVINGLLAVNEHFDDKASRTLSAMAFLTAAAAAIFTKAYSPNPPTELIRRKLYEALPTTVGVDVTNAISKATWDVPHASIWGVEWPLATFSVYMLLVFVGAVLYLTALGPFLNISKAWRSKIRPNRVTDKSQELPSLLFFYFVAEVGEEEWKEYWEKDRTPETLEREITSSYIKESRKIAQNARAKYTYLSVGSVFFILAIFCLMALVAGILSSDNKVAWLLTMIGGIAWSMTLAGVTKVRPPKESKVHWIYITATILLLVIAAILSINIWFR